MYTGEVCTSILTSLVYMHCGISFTASMSLVTCDTKDKAMSMLENVKDTPTLKWIVIWEPISDELLDKAKETGVDIVTLQEFLVSFLG